MENLSYNKYVNLSALSDERSLMSTTDKTFTVGIYIRLSQEDEKGTTSESVINQKELLTDYVNKNGHSLFDIYIDDGYTGTNFDRPAFKRMISDIEQGKINMVVTKDLSRLGRDYIETGHYLERYFPLKKVRYIALTDNIDTFLENDANNDIAPFKALFNDMYAKDISKKIRTNLRTMQKAGKWVGGCPPFGYKVDPTNKNHLVTDEIESPIVKRIFEMFIKGDTPHKIAVTLNLEKVPTFHLTRNRNLNRKNYKVNGLWEASTIKKMLRNQLYTGDMVQNRRQRLNYKYRKILVNPKSEWIVVENTHEPLIDKDTFNKVQELIPSCPRNDKKIFRLFDGLLYCYECGHKIGIRNKDKKGNSYMCCNFYRKNVQLKLCTSHGFNYDRLESALLRKIKGLVKSLINADLSESLKEHANNILENHNINLEIERCQNQLNSLKSSLDEMYLDKLSKKIDEDMFLRLRNKLNDEIFTLEKRLSELDEIGNNANVIDSQKLINELIEEFKKFKEPNRELILKLFKKIEIHQDKTVDVTFNFKELSYFYDKDITY